MNRRKHLAQSSLQQGGEPPEEGQHIVRAVGSRGSNIIEVEFPDGRATLCLLPAKFHKKLWIKKGTFLIVQEAPEAAQGSRVTGEIIAVLYDAAVKQLKRTPGVWPPEFASSSTSAAASSSAAPGEAAPSLEQLQLNDDSAPAAGPSSSNGEEAASGGACSSGGTQRHKPLGGSKGQPGGGDADSSSCSSEDDLPPIERINNRKFIEYAVSESESDDE